MRYILFLIACLTSASLIQAAESITLRYADLDIYLPKHGKIQEKEALRDAAHVRTGYLARSFWPTLALSSGGEAFQTGGSINRIDPFGSLDLSVNLFKGGQDEQEDKLRELHYKLAETRLRSSTLEERAHAQSLYWEIVHLSELITAHEDHQKMRQTWLASAKKRVARGLMTRTEILGFELQKSFSQEKIEKLKHAQQLLKITLATHLRLPEGAIVTIADTRFPHKEPASLLETKIAIEQNPTLRAHDMVQQIADVKKEKALRQNAPAVDLYGSYVGYTFRDRSFETLSDRFDFVTGIRLEVPLFTGSQSEQIQTLEHEAKALAFVRDQETVKLQETVKITREKLRYLDRFIHLSEDRIKDTKLFLKATMDDYDKGLNGASDVLGAMDTYLDYRVETINHRLDYQLSKVAFIGLAENR